MSDPNQPQPYSYSPPAPGVTATQPPYQAPGQPQPPYQAALQPPPTYQPPGSAGASSSKSRWYKKTWVIAVAAGVVGIGIGGASAGSTDVKTTSEYKAVAKDLDSSKADLAAAEAKLATVEGDLPAREQAVEEATSALDEREAAVEDGESKLKAAEKAVAKREKAVGIVEKEIESNTISDGLFEVGKDIKAGTYKTNGAGGCYYAVLADSNGTNIIANNLGDGPSIVTVRNGQFLEINCSGEDWVLQH